MSDAPTHIDVKIANTKLRIPLELDAKTTKTIASQVSERFRKIEAAEGRIDSQAFALQTAYHFAAQLHLAQQEATQDTNDLIKALEQIVTTLRDTLAEFQDDA